MDRERTINEDPKQMCTHVHTGAWYFAMIPDTACTKESTAQHSTAPHSDALRWECTFVIQQFSTYKPGVLVPVMILRTIPGMYERGTTALHGGRHSTAQHGAARHHTAGHCRGAALLS